MALIIYYLKFAFVFLWIFSCAFFTGIIGIFRYGHPNLLRNFVRLLAWGGTKISGIKLKVIGEHYMDQSIPAVLVGNHQSALDLVIFGRICPNGLTMVMKKELKYYPFLGLFFMICGSVFVDRKKGATAQKEINSIIPKLIKESRSIGFFPEGTRNRTGDGLLPFKKGAFHLAIAAQMPIVPIVCEPLHKVCNEKTKHAPGGEVELVVLPPILTQGLKASDASMLSDQVREAMLNQLKKWE